MRAGFSMAIKARGVGGVTNMSRTVPRRHENEKPPYLRRALAIHVTIVGARLASGDGLAVRWPANFRNRTTVASGTASKVSDRGFGRWARIVTVRSVLDMSPFSSKR